MEFATWATKERDLKDLLETVHEINELLDEILPLPEQQKRSDNSLMTTELSTLAPKSERADRPALHTRLEGFADIRRIDVADANGLGVRFIGAPC